MTPMTCCGSLSGHTHDCPMVSDRARKLPPSTAEGEKALQAARDAVAAMAPKRPAIVHVRFAVSARGRDRRIMARNRPETDAARSVCGGAITSYDVSRADVARMTDDEIADGGVCSACRRIIKAGG